MFKSRNIPADLFIKEFFDTLTPGVIPRNQFIDWNQITAKCAEFESVVDYFQRLAAVNPRSRQTDLRDSLLSADEPLEILKGGFEILGHTNDYYVSDEDNIDLEVKAKEISGGSTKAAANLAQVLMDLGLPRVLEKGDLQSAFFGVQVGLESNRRKSVGGKKFSNWVTNLLESTCGLLGSDWEVKSEQKIFYKDSSNSKKVDFALIQKGKTRIGVEINFFTTNGSKPTEIKRAYQSLNRDLARVGVELVWITDGAGYKKMVASLREAFEIHPNTYNLEMARRYLKDDIIDFAFDAK